ncbi:MAG TPA: methyltransferase domain-containing protein [Syntrophomonadaceae bacterium]|nr:methyltransferase domain-containing protein [Syntrophomonadaceae bacterium]
MINEISKYWSRDASEYDKSIQAEFRNQKGIEVWKNLLREALGEKIPQHVLDVGTGSGFLALLLAEMGHHVMAVDAAPGMLEIASKNAAQRGLQIDYRLSDASDLVGVAAETFDAVVSRHVVWTLPDPEKAYAEWWRVLRPKGRLIVVDGNWYLNLRSPFRRAWQVFAWILIFLSEGYKPWKRDRNEEFLQKLPLIDRLRPQEDQKFLDSCGFKVITIKSNINSQIRSIFEHLKAGYWGDTFMIVAEKPVN